MPCFFVLPPFRGKGVSRQLLTAALAIAQAYGADAVEGVPGDPATKQRTSAASYTGTVALFARAGFSEVARRTKSGRVIMRRQLGQPRGEDPDRDEG